MVLKIFIEKSIHSFNDNSYNPFFKIAVTRLSAFPSGTLHCSKSALIRASDFAHCSALSVSISHPVTTRIFAGRVI